ncbi:PepSY-associated TM helix domain-containing protein [Mucilaginibacter aquariorum]|uniref:PepSY domain-containing protein n=1 Tax=Mucilaginibacter aquariorum TaxID=2967225 RepID=A0ABT1SVP7_9SPHI|nr:PepSY-associated TM helix domain-containing protein [Mucilaginibacter aquariorum]MCQ6956414.1 PepSY domain-containing protein [Mucilaginibacter aquariorum]
MARKIFFWLHKWLGLTTGLVVLIVSLTGCINVFSDELKEYFYHDRFYVESGASSQFKNFSMLRDEAQKALGPKIKISRCEIYPAKGRTWIFRASLTNKKGIGYWNYNKYYYRVYVDPYKGKVVYVEDTRNEFFQLVLSLHRNLLLGDTVGGIVTGTSALCFFVLLLSGLILWFPRKWKAKAFKKALVLKRDVGPKRLNYDLHNISGFYILIPALLICITGLVFAFDWADKSVQYVAYGGKAEKRAIPLSTPNKTYEPVATDSVITLLLHIHPQADVFSIRFREKYTDPLDVQVRLAKNRTHLFQWYYFDRNNGKLLMKYGDQDVKGGEKFRSMNYDLHTGAYAGIPTKLLAFFIALICAAMPVTGFFIWYNRRSKRAKRSQALPTLIKNQTV